MTSARDKFQKLLRELFQFDCADLDFGIYRIMNYKRDVIEQFITSDLPRSIADELDRGELANQSQAAAELAKVAKQITRSLGKDAIDADGNLAEGYHGTPLGKQYLDLKGKVADGRGREALEATIFNHLHTFFSRYYLDGDFISKRRYSKRQKYAIPYNGEEVYLHWANHDQYYVKTAEHFHDYTFTSRGVIVHFKLKTAEVEQNNVKSETRFFVPRLKEVDWNEETGTLVIPFEYRPLTEQETATYGTKGQQEKIVAEAVDAIPSRLKKANRALLAITAERHKNSAGEIVSVLEHHLRQYTRRNTSDFFIHKDLKGFLSRELDFYLKNEVLNLDEMEAAGEDRSEGWFQIMRVIKAVGSRIIDFLDQVESFQKMLWEKRKFVTETQYCITVGTIDEGFYPKIAACEPQWVEWKELCHIDEEETKLFNAGKDKNGKRVAFLEEHPTLVLDTKHFDSEFVDDLIASMDELDSNTSGLLIHSENSQALTNLLEKCREQVECIYIDPPYNTGNDEFIYKDSYQHSCWLSMLSDRVSLSIPLLCPEGNLLVSCDDGEEHRLRLMLDSKFGKPNFMANLVWKSRQNVDSRATNNISNDHEFVLAYGVALRGGAKDREKYTNPDGDPRGPWMSDNMVGLASRKARPNLHFHLLVGQPSDCKKIPAGYSLTIEGMRLDVPCESVIGEDLSMEKVICACITIECDKVNAACNIPKPLDNRQILASLYKCPAKGWRYDPMSMASKIVDNRIVWPENPEGRPRKKTYLHELRSDFTGFSSVVGYTREGTGDLAALFGNDMGLSFPKPVSLIRTLVQQGTGRDDWVLDYFAGSGTTGHAVINLNREDNGDRKFALVEMAEFFDSVLLSRIKKVTFTSEWKDGKPKRLATAKEAARSPRVVKYIRLESYEDALNNIEFDDASGQSALKYDDYLLKYMLTWETRKSDTLLNVEKLADPFSYKLYIHKNGESREQTVDIPETFNYLLGLHVRTRRVYDDSGRRYLVYRGQVDHRQVVVIWRDTSGWEKKDLERDKRFVAEQNLTEGADEVFVNGDSFIPEARALEPVFKARMFAKVEM